MPSIDERIVAMAFENAKFEAGVATTMATLAKLDTMLKDIGKTNSLAELEKAASKVTLQQPMSALDKLKARLFGAGQGADQGLGDIERAGNKVTLEEPIKALNKVQSATADVGRNAADSFNEIEKASNHVELRGITDALSSVTKQFSVLQGAASVALGNIASQAAMRGASFAKSFTIAPIKQGLEEYQTNLNSIQTILANTSDSGGNLKTVNAALDELNHYSDKTIYNFSEMARNIGTFTAAGVRLKPATAAIKGIANLAALSGSNSQQASTAMYQLSQAIAAGKVGLQDWNSVVNAGMGGAVFQKALMRTAESMGALEKGAVNIDKATGKATVNGKSFRESIMARPGETSWLSSDVLTKTLSQFTGDMSDAQLAAQGFNAEQIKAIQTQAKLAQDAATQVKTLPQVFDVAKETIGSGWSATFKNIFGNFEESKKTFTALSNAINGVINTSANARNKMLGDWKELGGRTVLIEGLKQAFKDLAELIKPIGAAFRDIFPKQTGQGLFEMTKNFRDLARTLQPSQATIENLTRIFRGLFAVLHIGWTIVKDVIKVIGDLLGLAGHGAGGFLSLAGSVGDFFTALDTALTKGGALQGFFQTLTGVLQSPIKLLSELTHLFLGLFGNADGSRADALGASLEHVTKAAGPLAPVLRALKSAWDGMVDALGKAKDAASPWLDQIAEQLQHLGATISDAISNLDFDKVISVIQTGLIGGIFVALKRAVEGGTNALTSSLSGFNKVFSALTGNLVAMQQNVRANTVLQIAAAVGILAASTYALAKIDPKRLTSALTAMAVGMGELMGGIKLMTSGLGKTSILLMPFLAAGLIGVATAVTILAHAVKVFSTMSWEGIAKGLAGVAFGLDAINLGMKGFTGANMIAQGAGLIVVAGALNLIAVAMKQFASISWEDLGKGIYGVFLSLAAVLTPLTIAGPELLAVGPGLAAAAFGLNLLAGAVTVFAAMDPKKMFVGVAGLAAALLVIAPAVSLMALALPGTVALAAASVGIVALGAAMAVMGSLSLGQIGKALLAMGGALVILAAGVTAMALAAPGAVALMAAAAALAVLAPVLAFLGTLSWGTIFKGLAAMALALVTVSVAGAVAAPGIVLLATALLPLGAAFFLVAGAANLFAKAISLVANDGGKGVGVLIAAITAFIALIPKFIVSILKGFLDVLSSVADVAPKVVMALGVIIDTIIAFVLANAGRLAVAAGSMIDAFLAIFLQNEPKLQDAGFKIVLNLLAGLDKNIPQIVSRGTSIIEKFLGGLASEASKIGAAGTALVANFIKGIASKISSLSAAAVNLVASLLSGISGQLPKLLTLGINAVANFVTGVLGQISRVVLAGVHVVTSIIAGIAKAVPDIVGQASSVVKKFVAAIANEGPAMVDAGFKALIKFLHGIASAIRTNEGDLIAAGGDIADAIIDGLVDGLEQLAPKAIHKITSVMGSLPAAAKKVLGIHSPSTVFAEIGTNIVDGVAVGLDAMEPMLQNSITDPIHKMLAANKDVGEFGKFIGTEFKDGLTGGLFDDGQSQATKSITGAFSALTTKLHDEQAKLRDAIKSDRDQLQQELDKEPKDRDEALINKLSSNLAANRNLLNQATTATTSLVKNLRSTKAELISLGDDYTAVSEKLQAAQQALDSATQARDQALQGYKDKFSQTPDVSSLASDALQQAQMTPEERAAAAAKKAGEERKAAQINQVALYEQAMAQQIAATQKFQTTLQQLRDLGLDDTTYKKLLEMGTAGQQFADQLLTSGKGGVDQLNKMDADLLASSTKLAQDAATNLYQAGVDAAAGLVKGLQDQQSNIRKTMEAIAASMVHAIKSKLKIKSPSQVFMEVGKFSTEGMVVGLQNGTSNVASAASDLGDAATLSLQTSMSKLGTTLSSGIDTSPKITPVLDLTHVKSGIQDVNSGLNSIDPGKLSFGIASSIVSETGARQAAQAQDAEIPGGGIIRFEQNNYSPEALPAAEIYRNTQNQLSQVKSGLGFVTGQSVTFGK